MASALTTCVGWCTWMKKNSITCILKHEGKAHITKPRVEAITSTTTPLDLLKALIKIWIKFGYFSQAPRQGGWWKN